MFKPILALTFAVLAQSALANEVYSLPKVKENIMKSIKLETQVGTLAANLYLPEHVDKPAVVIVTGAWTTVKEQMPNTYAQALVKEGYAAVTFDFRGWGASEDTIKYLEDPQRKIADIRAVIEAVTKLDMIDTSKIAGLGICASAGYMLDAIAGNAKVKAAAVVAPWLHDKAMATTIYGGVDNTAKLIAAAKQANESLAPVYIEAASTTNSEALMFQAPYYTETDRGLIPEYDNKFNVGSWDAWLNYDAQLSASIQDKPVIFVASEAMALPVGAHTYLKNAGDNVQAVWLDNINQFDFYDQPQAVKLSVEAIVQHFQQYL